MKNNNKLLACPYIVWMILFTIIPLGIVFYYALTDSITGQFTLAILYSINNILHLSWITRHHQVVASLNFLFQRKVGTLTNPVGLHDSLISPVVAENIGKEPLVALRINTVDFVIGRHNSPRIALANHHLETLQIQLTESTLAQSLIHLGTVSFLRVHGKVLGTYTHALTLYTLYKGGSDKTRYDWIF